MTNPYYSTTFDVSPGGSVGSQRLEDQFLSVQNGFDAVQAAIGTTGILTSDNTWTGINVFPTQAAGNSTTRVATTAFVQGIFSYANTWTASQIFEGSWLKVKGSSTGVTAIISGNAGATNYVLTLPTATGTLATLADISAATQVLGVPIAASDETTAITAGTAKVTFRMPYAMTLTEVFASLTEAQASGSIFTVDINESGASILSTKITIDNTETISTTAATPPVISDTALAKYAEITIDVDQIGDGTATGLKVYLVGTAA